MDHLLIHYEFTQVVFMIVFQYFKIDWVLSSIMKEILIQWESPFVSMRLQKLWELSLAHF